MVSHVSNKPDKVETMQQMPWETPIYRNRHGRGTRTPMFGTRLPRYRTRSGMFDDMLVAQIRRLNGAWPELIAPVQFAVEDVPPSDPALGRTFRILDRSISRRHGIPPRIVLYRMPLQSHARNRMDLQFAIRDEVVSRLAEIYGRRPEEIDPDWGM